MCILTTYSNSGSVNEIYNIDNLAIDKDSIENYLKNFKSKNINKEHNTKFVSLTLPNQNLYALYQYGEGLAFYINNKMLQYNTIDLIDTFPDYDPFGSFIKLTAALGRSECTCNMKASWIIIDTIKDSIYNSGYDLEKLENDTTTTIFDVVDFNEIIDEYLKS